MLSILDKIYDDLKRLVLWLFHLIWPVKADEDRAADRWQGRPGTLGKRFFGRDADLKTLADAVKDHPVVVISGGAGAGKSQLAAEHTYERRKGGFWTTAGNDANATLAALAPLLGVDRQDRGDDEVATIVRERLGRLTRDAVWVVDNLADIDQLNALTGLPKRLKLLATTRDSRRHLLPAGAAFCPIDVIDLPAATAMLASKSETRAGDPQLAEIADEVGRLPLALEMLAVRLGQPGVTLENLLDELRNAPSMEAVEAFKQAAGANIPRPEGVYATLAGALDRLPEDVRKQIGPLAYVADAPVPDPLVRALTGTDSDQPAFLELLEACQHESLLAWRDDEVTAHALTLAAMAATNPDGAVEVAVSRARRRLAAIVENDPVSLRAEFVHHQRLLEQATAALGEEHEYRLALANSVAIGYGTLGRLQEHVGLCQRVLATRERDLGPDHLDTLGSRNNLAGAYQTVGRNEDAMGLHEQTLAALERVLGSEHPDTLTSRSNLANAYGDVGRHDDAVGLHEQTLAAKERVLGPDHPDTLTSRNNLAIAYRAVGRHEDSLRLHEQTLAARERVLATDHPDTLGSRNNLAIAYNGVGRHEHAIRLHEQTLSTMQRVLGPDHPETLASRNNLAAAYQTVGRHEDAIHLHEQTLAAREWVLGPSHPFTRDTRKNLAIAYRNLGRHADAERLEEETPERQE